MLKNPASRNSSTDITDRTRAEERERKQSERLADLIPQPEGIGDMVRALGWNPTVVGTVERLLGTLRATSPDTWPDVLILEAQTKDSDMDRLIAQFETEHGHGEWPPIVVIANDTEDCHEQQQSWIADVLLMRPVSSCSLFNAINTAVGKRTGGYERVLQSTDVDELHAQLLAGVRVLVVDDCEALELSNPAIPATHCSLVPGIDSGILHGTFGDDLSLFKSLLGRMLRDFADLALPVSLEDQASREQLMARVHKLKGSASIMGATRVIRLAGAAESALQQDRTIEVVERILRQLAAALATLGEDAAPLLAEEIKPTSDETPAAGTGARPSGPTAQIRELQSLLESQNFAATDRFSALSRSLTEMLGEVRFNELCEAVDDLDFPRAARLLRETVSVKKRARTARVR